jgi:pimeloyl-ACP methyl ester carboxylesterase
MAIFALVHGGGHRGWHWHLVRPWLERRGHQVVTPDVPMDDATKGAADWADVVIEALPDIDEDDVVVVGHSFAGLALPVIASRINVRRMVFLCANVPMPGTTYTEYLAEHPDAIIFPDERLAYDEQGRRLVPWSLAREVFYPDCGETLATEAHARLVPIATTGFTERCPIEVWPDAPATYILCADDLVVGPRWSREVSVARLGGPAVELPGGHSPFLSRPEQLASTLDRLVSLR